MRLAKIGCIFLYLDIPLTKYNHYTKGNCITNNFEVIEKSCNIIENKFKNDFYLLSARDKKLHNIYKYNSILFKVYLNKQYFISIFYNIKAFFKFKKLIYLGFAFASLFGPTFIFRLRWLKSIFHNRK
jgi:hypothetical protein